MTLPDTWKFKDVSVTVSPSEAVYGTPSSLGVGVGVAVGVAVGTGVGVGVSVTFIHCLGEVVEKIHRIVPPVSVSKVQSDVSAEVGAIAQVVFRSAELPGARNSVPNISIIFSEFTKAFTTLFWSRNSAVITLICSLDLLTKCQLV